MLTKLIVCTLFVLRNKWFIAEPCSYPLFVETIRTAFQYVGLKVFPHHDVRLCYGLQAKTAQATLKYLRQNEMR